jgi:hypothetical protein
LNQGAGRQAENGQSGKKNCAYNRFHGITFIFC